MDFEKYKDYLELRIGKFDIFFKKPYQILYNLNDLIISLCFLTGSILFLLDKWEEIALWAFLIGSTQLTARPLIRIIHSIHLKRYLNKHYSDYSNH